MTTEAEPAIRINALCKTYRSKNSQPKRALDEVIDALVTEHQAELLATEGAA